MCQNVNEKQYQSGHSLLSWTLSNRDNLVYFDCETSNVCLWKSHSNPFLEPTSSGSTKQWGYSFLLKETTGAFAWALSKSLTSIHQLRVTSQPSQNSDHIHNKTRTRIKLTQKIKLKTVRRVLVKATAGPDAIVELNLPPDIFRL